MIPGFQGSRVASYLCTATRMLAASRCGAPGLCLGVWVGLGANPTIIDLVA